jgi:Family of unknown function (DUF6069)
MNTTSMNSATITSPINGAGATTDPRTGYAFDWSAYNSQQAAAAAASQRPAIAPTAADAPRLDQVRYWVGATITAVLAALISLIALVVAKGIVHVPMVIGSTSINVAVYGVCAAGIALLAAALYDAMLHVAPRPLTYYSWLGGFVTVLATLLPFTSTAGLHSQIALAATNFAVGAVITLLVPIAASNARRGSQSAR